MFADFDATVPVDYAFTAVDNAAPAVDNARGWGCDVFASVVVLGCAAVRAAERGVLNDSAAAKRHELLRRFLLVI